MARGNEPVNRLKPPRGILREENDRLRGTAPGRLGMSEARRRLRAVPKARRRLVSADEQAARDERGQLLAELRASGTRLEERGDRQFVVIRLPDDPVLLARRPAAAKRRRARPPQP